MAPALASGSRLVACAVLLFLLAGTAAAQDWKGRGRLQGKVDGPDGKPYAGAQVFLLFEGNEDAGPDSIVTDKKGRWAYLGLAGGSWTVRIEAEGLLTSEGSVQVSEGQPGASQPIHIQLKEIPVEAKAAQAMERIEQGNALMKQGSYAEARAAYEEAFPDTPPASRPALLRGIAQSYSLEGNRTEAIASLEKSLALAPDDTATLRLLIDLFVQEGDKEKAAEYMARLPEGEKLDFAQRLNLGIDLYNDGDYDGALVHFEQAIHDYPQEADGYYYRGMVALAQENQDIALADLEKFLELAPADHPKRGEAEEFVKYLSPGS